MNLPIGHWYSGIMLVSKIKDRGSIPR